MPVCIVLPTLPLAPGQVSPVQPLHVTRSWEVVPSDFVPVQNSCNPRALPVESMLVFCRSDPSVRSVKSSAIFVPSGSTYGWEDLVKRVSGPSVPSDNQAK